MDISSKIKLLLKQNKKTQAQLADHLGYSRSFVSYVLRGKKRMSLEMLEGTCGFFGIELADFFRSETSIPSYTTDFYALCRDLTEKEIEVLRTVAEMLPTRHQVSKNKAEKK